jgi:hypothetical protein
LAVERLSKLDKDLDDPDESLINKIQIGYRIEGKIVGAHLIDTTQDQQSVLNQCLSRVGLL